MPRRMMLAGWRAGLARGTARSPHPAGAVAASAGLLVLAGAFFAAPPAGAADVVIGTGSRQGVYHYLGRAICQLVSNDAASGATCAVKPTGGSLDNIEAVLDGTIEVGVVQSDVQFHAYSGTGPFAVEGPAEGLRALFSVHAEPFTALARRDAGIETFDDFRGKRVNLGNPGSGQRATMDAVMRAMGWTEDDFRLAADLRLAEQSLALCHDRVQAMAYTIGHPNPATSKATGLCGARIVPVTGPEIDALLEANPFYAPATIPGGIYSNNPDPVPTFGTLATVVSSAAAEPEAVYAVVKAVFDDLDGFRALHPAWAGLEAAAMVRDGLSAPLHEGAARYYREAGLLPEEPNRARMEEADDAG